MRRPRTFTLSLLHPRHPAKNCRLLASRRKIPSFRFAQFDTTSDSRFVACLCRSSSCVFVHQGKGSTSCGSKPPRAYRYRLKVNQLAPERTVFFVKILVTGGAGYIGGTVSGCLTEKGHEAVIFDNLCHSRREMLPAGVEFVEGELRDRAVAGKSFRRCPGNDNALSCRTPLCCADRGRRIDAAAGDLLPQQHRLNADAA